MITNILTVFLQPRYRQPMAYQITCLLCIIQMIDNYVSLLLSIFQFYRIYTYFNYGVRLSSIEIARLSVYRIASLGYRFLWICIIFGGYEFSWFCGFVVEKLVACCMEGSSLILSIWEGLPPTAYHIIGSKFICPLYDLSSFLSETLCLEVLDINICE